MVQLFVPLCLVLLQQLSAMTQRLINTPLLCLGSFTEAFKPSLLCSDFQDFLFQATNAPCQILDQVLLHACKQLFLLSLLLLCELFLRDISLLLNLGLRWKFLLEVNLCMLLNIMLAQKLLIREELGAVFALHSLSMVSFFWNFYQIFICCQSLLFYLVLLLQITQFSIVFLNSISNFFG